MAPKIGYLEIPVVDAARAEEFFRRVFGWSGRRSEWTEGVHVVLENAVGSIGCAMVERSAVGLRGPTPVVHLAEADLEACLESISMAGGVVIETARSVDGLGRFARFRDTEGNLWGLWADAEERRQD